MQKLILVTVRFRNRVNYKLVDAIMVNGHATIPQSIITEMAKEIGACDGDTISIG